jgi:hypothetical protein
MERTTRCQCGGLSATATGEPQMVGVCHCQDCQRRTGSAFGFAAYYPKQQVRVDGPRTIFTRKGTSGSDLRFSFCPTCGTTIYWEVDSANVCGVAIGALEGPKFQEPTHSWWERSMHGWVRMPENIQHHI